MEYKRRYMDKYKKFIAQGWYENILSTERLNLWNKNFSQNFHETNDFDPKICAHFLLNALIFYQESHIVALIKSIINKIKSELNQTHEKILTRRLTDEEFNNIWNDFKSKACIIPAADPKDVGDSALIISRLWRNNIDIEAKSVLELPDIIHTKKNIIFVDDFIGTGTKMNKFFNNILIKTATEDLSVGEFIRRESCKCDFNICISACYFEGCNKICSDYPEIKFYYGDLYTSDYNLLSPDCVFYDLFENNKEEIIKYINKVAHELKGNTKFIRNLPIAFHHGCPNNSLPLYYSSTNNWEKLLPETHPKEKGEI